MSVWNLQTEKLLPPSLYALKIYYCRIWPWVDKRKAIPFLVAVEEPPQVILRDEQKLVSISRKVSPIKYQREGVYIDGQPPKIGQLEEILRNRPKAQVEYRIPLGEKVIVRAFFTSGLTEAVITAEGSNRLKPIRWTNLSPWIVIDYLTKPEKQKQLRLKILDLIL